MAACVRKVYNNDKKIIKQLGWRPLDFEALGFSLPSLNVIPALTTMY